MTSLDPSRTHWLGSLQTDDYHRVLASSDVHLYLTVPFVLSWSLLEAMAAGCSIVASDTPPVREVIRHGENGLLVDFFSPHRQAEAIESLLDSDQRKQSLSESAKRTADFYGCDRGLQDWTDLMSVNSHQTAHRPGRGTAPGV